MARATLISQLLRSGENPDRYTIQTIGCFPLEEVDLVDCPCAPASGCTWLKSTYKVPIPLGSFTNVTSLDGSISYDYTNWADVKYKFNSRLAGERKLPTYTTKDGYIYVHNDIHKMFITLSGIFYDPIAPQLLKACEGKYDDCENPLELEFPFNTELHAVLFDTAFKSLLNVKNASNTDIRNDAQQNFGRDDEQKK